MSRIVMASHVVSPLLDATADPVPYRSSPRDAVDRGDGEPARRPELAVAARPRFARHLPGDGPQSVARIPAAVSRVFWPCFCGPTHPLFGREGVTPWPISRDSPR